MARIVFYRYADDVEAALVYENRRIESGPNQTCKWYSPDRYESGADARRFLSLSYTPTHRIGPIPADDLPDFDHTDLQGVLPNFGQPGGGLQAATTKTFYLFDITRIP